MSLPDYKARIILLGNCNVGKTSYTRSFVDPFNYNYMPTVGVEYGSAITRINNNTSIKCQIWDTAGNEKFASIISCYYKNIAGVIIMFDLTNKNSFINCNYWWNEFHKHKNSDKYISKLLIGNKLDMKSKRQVSKKDAEIFAKKIGFNYMEISTKKNINKHESLNVIAKDMYNNMHNIEKGIENMHIIVNDNTQIIVKNNRDWCRQTECPICTIS
jgi:small GTP-binding protein